MHRRSWLRTATCGLGSIALSSLLDPTLLGSAARGAEPGGLPGLPHYTPRARRVIFLSQSGGPSQVDLFDWKPDLARRHGEELPESVRKGQRLTTMTADQVSKPITAPPFSFSKYGQCGTDLSELLPHLATVVDELCMIRSMQTNAINHDPAMTFLHTGNVLAGHPSLGAWTSYGLGNGCDNLPAFIVLFSGGAPGDQPLSARLWGSGFLPPQHQGVRLRGGREPVLYLANPPGIDSDTRRDMLDTLRTLNQRHFDAVLDPEINARIEQFELAFRMQTAVPDLADVSNEPASVLQSYGTEVTQPGTYASNCLLARRLIERGVRFVQLFHRGWDHHDNLVDRLTLKCRQTDQATAALIADLRQRGLLDDTLVVWAGEFGRTVFCQGSLGTDSYGRDHHPRCFTIWMAGGGVKRGFTYGRTDEFSFDVVENPVHVHDLLATILHVLGIDHRRFTFRFEGRDQRLTDIGGELVKGILA